LRPGVYLACVAATWAKASAHSRHATLLPLRDDVRPTLEVLRSEVHALSNITTGLVMKRLTPDVSITSGNPFLIDDDGVLTMPIASLPPNLIDRLAEEGCQYAWVRQQHTKSELDLRCNDLIEPFVASTPSAALALLQGILSSGMVDEDMGAYTNILEDVAIWSAQDLLVGAEDASGNVSFRVNLSRFGWTREAPALVQPIRGYSKDELSDMEAKGSWLMPYVFHVYGEWMMRYAVRWLASGGVVDAQHDVRENPTREGDIATPTLSIADLSITSDTALMINATKLVTEVALLLSYHLMHQDPVSGLDLGPAFIGRTLVIHANHASLWTFLATQMDNPLSPYFQPSSQLAWELLETLFGEASRVDFALKVSSAHGLGHALTWYLTDSGASGRNASSIPATVGLCSEDPPLAEDGLVDYRLVWHCQTGFFHEMERSALWKALNQSFGPMGEQAPCRLSGSSALACFGHMGSRVRWHRIVPAEWWRTAPDGEDNLVINLTPEGVKGWGDTLAFCHGDPYPGYTAEEQAACITNWVWWMQDYVASEQVSYHIQEALGTMGEADAVFGDTGNLKGLRKDMESFIHATQAAAATAPRVSDVTSTHAKSTDGRRVAQTTAAQGTHALRGTRFGTSPVSTPRSVDPSWTVPRLRASSTLCDDDCFALAMCQAATANVSYWAWLGCTISNDHYPEVSAMAYRTLPAAHSVDSWKVVMDGSDEDQAAGKCTSLFNATRFEPGTEQELHFATQMCVDNVRSHGARPHPLLVWDQLPAMYQRFLEGDSGRANTRGEHPRG